MTGRMRLNYLREFSEFDATFVEDRARLPTVSNETKLDYGSSLTALSIPYSWEYTTSEIPTWVIFTLQVKQGQLYKNGKHSGIKNREKPPTYCNKGWNLL